MVRYGMLTDSVNSELWRYYENSLLLVWSLKPIVVPHDTNKPRSIEKIILYRETLEQFMLGSEAWGNTKDMCHSPLNYKGDFLFYSPKP